MAGGTGHLVLPLVDEGLGNSAYLVDLGDGRGLAIDPSRDLRRFDDSARQLGIAVAFAAETHLHADFVSGATRLLARDGAEAIGSAEGGREFPHRGLHDGDSVDFGGISLRAWATPGHTAEHLSYVLEAGTDVLGVFTGGSLIVGAAARTDLVSPEMTEPLARAQFRSLRRLLQLPDDTPVYPTHGAGSFCSAPPGADRVTTIGREREENRLLSIADEDEFVAALLGSLGSFPPYFHRLGEVNRHGPAPIEGGTLAPMTTSEVVAWRDRGAEVVDVRPVTDYAAGHIPGSLSIVLRSVFATWLGWTVADSDTPLVVVRNPDQDPEEILWQARKVGYDAVVGELQGGVETWRAAGEAVATTGLVGPGDLGGRNLIDIRQRAEFASGHVPGAHHVELGSIAGADLPDGPLVAMCGHGERAATAASILERAGRVDVAVLLGGPEDYSASTGTPLLTEPT